MTAPGGDDVEQKEADLARLLHPSSGYAHATNLLVSLRAYRQFMPHDEAINRLHSEVAEWPDKF